MLEDESVFTAETVEDGYRFEGEELALEWTRKNVSSRSSRASSTTSVNRPERLVLRMSGKGNARQSARIAVMTGSTIEVMESGNRVEEALTGSDAFTLVLSLGIWVALDQRSIGIR